jgi:signal transduction histidine kinase
MDPTPGAAPLPRRFAFALLGLGALFVAAKLPALDLPFYWDEQAYVLPSAWLAREGLVHVLPGLHPPGQFFGHPPLLYLLLGAQFAAFGETRWIPHALVLGFALAALALTFAIGRRVRDAYTGLVAALLLAAMPIFFAQSVMALADVVIAALGLAAVYACLLRRRRGLPRGRDGARAQQGDRLAIVAACAVYASVVAPRGTRWRTGMLHAARRSRSRCSSPPSTGRPMRWSPTATSRRTRSGTRACSAVQIVRLVARVARGLLFSQGKWALAAFVTVALLLRPRDLWRGELALFAGIAAAFGAAFVLIFFLPRYLIPVLPFYCVAAAWAIASLASGRAWLRVAAPLAAVACLLPHLARHCDRFGGMEADLCYVDAVRVDRAAADWLAQQPADSTGVVPWPYAQNLRQPVLGYVAQPAPASLRGVAESGPDPDFVLVAPSSTTEQEDARLRALLAAERVRAARALRERAVVRRGVRAHGCAVTRDG